MCTTDWHFQHCVTVLHNHHPKGKLVPLSSLSPFSTLSLATTYQLSASVNLPIPDISYGIILYVWPFVSGVFHLMVKLENCLIM